MAERVNWTDEENVQLATEAHRALLADPKLDVLEAIRQAQATLPKKRRRDLRTWRMCEPAVTALERIAKQKLQVKGVGGRVALRFVRPSSSTPSPSPKPKAVQPAVVEQRDDGAVARRIAELEQQLTAARREADEANQRHASLRDASEATAEALAAEQAARQALQEALQRVSAPAPAPTPSPTLSAPQATAPGSILGHLQAAMELVVAAAISKALATPTVRGALLDAWVDLQSVAAPEVKATTIAAAPSSAPSETLVLREPETPTLLTEDKPKTKLPRVLILGLLPGPQRETLRQEFNGHLNLIFLKDEPVDMIKQHAKNAERVLAVANFTSANQRAAIKAASKSYATVTGTTNELRHLLHQYLDDFEGAKAVHLPHNGSGIVLASALR